MFDKISEKIDYMFRRSKNADERCFDFFLRSITFFIILLVVLFYGSFVHADESYTTIGDAGLITEVFTSEGLNSALSSSNKSTSDFVNVGIASGLSSYPFSLDDLQNLKIPISITYNGNTYSPEDYFIFLARGNVSDHGINYLTCYIFVGEDLVIGNAGYTVFNFESSGIGVFAVAVNPNNLNQLWDGNPVYTQQTQGIISTTNGFDSNITYQYFSIPTPIYYASNQFYGLLLDNNVDSNVRSDFAYQYYHYYDNVYQLNYLYDQLHYEPEVVESNINHLYLNDIQVGLTANAPDQDLISSEIIFGCQADDWILNHIDDYSMYIGFTISAKDTMPTTPNDPTSTYSVIVPLRAFMYNNYMIGTAEVLKNCNISGYGNFLSYYSALNDGGIKVLAKNTFNAILYYFLESNIKGLGDYYVKTVDTFNNTPYTIFDFDLTVACTLVDNISDETSAPYIKEFDFANGVTSVKSAEILRNYNPWDGEPTPQQSPLLPSAGNNNSLGSYGGGSNISINVSGQKVPIGVRTRAEIETILNNYKSVNDTFMDQWQDLSEPNNNNNFIKYLNQETKQLPAVDYMIAGACCVFGLSILLFILKVLLF